MKLLFRWSVGAGVLAGLLTCSSYACPTLSAKVGLNLSEWVAMNVYLEKEHRRGEILDHRAQRVHHSLEVKTRVMEDLRANRLTLLAAAARFRDLGGSAPGSYLAWSRLRNPSQTDEERWCRQVIQFLRGHSVEGPLVDQFEAELAEHLARGPLHLPD
jgi:hypothetical protein